MLKGSLSNIGVHHILNDGNLILVKDTLKDYSTESQDQLCRSI